MTEREHPPREASMHHGSDDPTGPEDFAATYAAFAANLRAETLPETVRQAARANLLDTLACAFAGYSAAGVPETLGLIRSWGGAPQAAIWCAGTRVPAHHAAWINGMMAHARDYDDTHDAAILHAGVSVVPAALAAAELNPNATGADLLAGIVVGLDLVCRLGMATTIGIIESGFIYTSLFGYFGATAAAARVLGLDARQTVNALGIAYSQAAGTHQVTRDAALTKRMQPGLAAKAALASVQLAQREIRGAQNTFEGEDGLFRTYLRGRYNPEVLRQDLGTRFEFTELSYKPYPCCRFNHTAIDAALAIASQSGFDPARIDRIEVGLNSQAYQAVCTPPDVRLRPQTIVQAQFSIPFTVAAALLDRRVSLQHFTDAGIDRPDILALAAKVHSTVDEAIERDWSRNISPAAIEVQQGNQILTNRTDYPTGHPNAPMTAQAAEAKLQDCLAFSGLDWPADTSARLRDLTANIERLKSGRELTDFMIHPARKAG